MLQAWIQAYSYTDDTVDFQYRRVSSAYQSLLDYYGGNSDFSIMDVPLAHELQEYNVIQLPLMGTGLVMAYRIPTINPLTDPVLVLDCPTVAKIWMDEITYWDDPAIIALNPVLFNSGRLSHEPIMLGYLTTDAGRWGQTDAFAGILGSCYANFSKMWQEAVDIEHLPPVLQGRGIPCNSVADVISSVQVIIIPKNLMLQLFFFYVGLYSNSSNWWCSTRARLTTEQQLCDDFHGLLLC